MGNSSGVAGNRAGNMTGELIIYLYINPLDKGSGYTGGKTVKYRLAQAKFTTGGKFFTALPHGLRALLNCLLIILINAMTSADSAIICRAGRAEDQYETILTL